MRYQIAGIDVHKKMLAVVVANGEVEGDYQFERREGGDEPWRTARAGRLARRARSRGSRDGIDRAVLAARVGGAGAALAAERRTRDGASPLSGTLTLPSAVESWGGWSEAGFPDAERLVKRLVAQELTLSFVPDAEQRLWRTVMRRKYQITRNRVQLHNRLESLLEEAHIKLSSVVSDLLGTSARRMLQALADGETDPATWPLSRTSDCAQRPTNCATPSARARISIRVSATGEAHAGGIASARRPPRPTRSTDGGATQSSSRCRPPTRRGAGVGRRFCAADHRGSRRHRRDVSFSQTPRLLDGRMPGHRGERGQKLQSSLPQGQPPDATRPESGCECRREGKGTIFAIVYRGSSRASGTRKRSAPSLTGSVV